MPFLGNEFSKIFEEEKTHGRKYHLIPHQGDGIPWRRNLSCSYVPGESTLSLIYSNQKNFISMEGFVLKDMWLVYHF